MAHHPAHAKVAQAAILLAILLLSGCASAPPASAPSTASLPPAPPLPIAGAVVYHVLPQASELRIRVYRGGALADIGHNHVITTSDIEGEIYLHPQIGASGFRLEIPLQSLKVDPAAARRDAGFEATVTDDDRAGTRSNMLGEDVLDADKYPMMTLRSIKVQGPDWYPRITVRVTLHGTSHDYAVPTAVVRGDGRLTAIGGLTLKQSDFGITPFSALAGALKVLDRLNVSFHLVAAPDKNSGGNTASVAAR